ncbi:MAG TPA: hypothetical protein VK578_10080 [Edaphobacter sp.]|nr:hypothetical protein [Edaphobacter sp.]
MARPKVSPGLRRSTTVSTALTAKLRYQTELAAEIVGKSLASFVESAIEDALHRVKLPHPTGIPLKEQKDMDPAFREQLDEKRVDKLIAQEKTTSVADEVVLWNEDPAVRFFLRGYLAEETLDPAAQEVWSAIQSKTAIEWVMPHQGRTFRSSEWPPARVERYICHHWQTVQKILEGELSTDALPDEKLVRDSRATSSIVKPRSR